MGHGLHSIKEKNAKASLLRQSNMAAAAARSQRLKQNHARETTATRATTITWDFFFPSIAMKNSILFYSGAGSITIPAKLFPWFGNEKVFPPL